MHSRNNKGTSKDELVLVEVMKVLGGLEVSFHLFLTSTTDADE
jgi:hypothetical protein